MTKLPSLDPATLSGGRKVLYDKIWSGPRDHAGEDRATMNFIAQQLMSVIKTFGTIEPAS